MLPVQVKKQVIYGGKYINCFCTAGKVTICHKVWVFMAYKMQIECLETKKITYVLIAGNLPVITGVQTFCIRHPCLKPVLGG